MSGEGESVQHLGPARLQPEASRVQRLLNRVLKSKGVAPRRGDDPEAGNTLGFLKMYTIPGHGELTQREYEKYLHCKTKWDEQIRQEAELSHKLLRTWNVPRDQVQDLIRRGFESKNFGTRFQAARVAGYKYPEFANVTAQLVVEGLNNQDHKIRNDAVAMVNESSWAHLRPLVLAYLREGTHSQDVVLRIEAAALAKDTSLVSELQQLALQEVKKRFMSEDSETRLQAAELIRNKSWTEELRPFIAQHIREGLRNQDPILSKEAVSMIRYAPDTDRVELIKLGFASNDPETRLQAAELIGWAPPQQWEDLARTGLASTDLQVGLAIISFIQGISSMNKRQDLEPIVLQKTEEGLRSEDPSTRLQAAALVNDVFEARKKLAPILIATVKEGLFSPDPDMRLHSTRMIKYVPFDQRTRFIKIGLESEDPAIRQEAARMIEYVEWSDRDKLRQFAQKTLGDSFAWDFVMSRLYKDTDLDSSHFARKNFWKTGSETTLLGGSLKDKVIVRHITAEAFTAWQKLYENYQLWQKAGFDYVPIEPIVSYAFNQQTGLVDVYTGVLDLNLHEWMVKMGSSKWTSKLESERDTIERVVNQEQISHAHTHEANFCLRLDRDKEGNVVLASKPRIYLIDFDLATIRE